jgi:hypothetical protein
VLSAVQDNRRRIDEVHESLASLRALLSRDTAGEARGVNGGGGGAGALGSHVPPQQLPLPPLPPLPQALGAFCGALDEGGAPTPSLAYPPHPTSPPTRHFPPRLRHPTLPETSRLQPCACRLQPYVSVSGPLHVTWLSPPGAAASPVEVAHALHTLLVLVSNQIKHPSDPRYHRMQARAQP